MDAYAVSGACRWKLLLDYFGDEVEGFEQCCACDHCLNPPQLAGREIRDDECVAGDQVTIAFPGQGTRSFLAHYVQPAWGGFAITPGPANGCSSARARPCTVYANARTRRGPGRTLLRRIGNIRGPWFNNKENIIKTSQKLLTGLMALVPFFSISLASAPAQAQQYATTTVVTQPRIRGFEVDEVRRLVPGAELEFKLYGTPGGRASLNIKGATRNLALTETEPGQYEGTYVIGTRDRIIASSAVTANLRVGNLVTSGVLSESVQREPGSRRRHDRDYAMAADAPRIERFDVRGDDALTAGNELNFTVYGTPGAKVDMAIEGTRGVFFLPEVKPGEYSGEYVIRRSDRIQPNSVVTANMRIGNRVATSKLNKPLLVAGVPVTTPRVVRYCTNCATVEAINVVQVDGDGNYLGTIGGGVVGAALGSQVGKGSGRTAAQIAGALGGAYVGRNIERNAKRTQHYEVVIRYTNGGTQTITYENDPGLRVGEKVKVNNGVLERDAS